MKAVPLNPPVVCSIAELPLPKPRIADHQLLRCIGRGSYGEVWLARSLTGSYRAMKIIARAPEFDAGFERELAGLRKFEPTSRNSTGLVHILQVGEDPAHQFFYYIMELADDGNREEPASASHSAAVRGVLNPESYVPRTLALEKRRRGRLFRDRISRNCRGAIRRALEPARARLGASRSQAFEYHIRPRASEAGRYRPRR